MDRHIERLTGRKITLALEPYPWRSDPTSSRWLQPKDFRYNEESIGTKRITGCSLNIVFFFKFLWFFWTLPVLLHHWCSTCHLAVQAWSPVYTHWHQGKTEKGQSPDYFFKIFEKAQYFMNTLYVLPVLKAYAAICMDTLLMVTDIGCEAREMIKRSVHIWSHI